MTGYLAFIFFASIAGNPVDASLVLHWKEAVNLANCETLTQGYLDRMKGAPVAVSYFCGDPNKVSVIPSSRPAAAPIIVTVTPTFEIDGPSMVGSGAQP